jgi:hypothetical protein
MSAKTTIYLTVLIGSMVGGYLPVLWGGSLFSVSSVLLSGLGGIIGLILGYKISR